MGQVVTWDEFLGTLDAEDAAGFEGDSVPDQFRVDEWLVAAFRVTHTTGNHRYAATDAFFDLIVTPRSQPPLTLQFPDLPEDERERNRTNTYKLDVTGRRIHYWDVRNGDIQMRVRPPLSSARQRNAWQPSYFKVIVDTVGSRYDFELIERSWPETKWFSGDTDEVISGISGARARPAWDLDDV